MRGVLCQFEPDWIPGQGGSYAEYKNAGSAGENVHYLLRQFGKKRMVQSNGNCDYTCEYEAH